jgi:hypothetical protein
VSKPLEYVQFCQQLRLAIGLSSPLAARNVKLSIAELKHTEASGRRPTAGAVQEPDRGHRHQDIDSAVHQFAGKALLPGPATY